MSLKQPLLALGVLLSTTTFNAQASLISYTGAGGVGLVYDNVTNLTWTKDANLLNTLATAQGYTKLVNAIIAASPVINDTPNPWDTPAMSGHYTVSAADFSAGGFVNWFGAQAFTGYLNSINYGGSTQWALPSAGANPQTGSELTDTAFGQLFYNELGGRVGSNIPNTTTFDNEQEHADWYGYWLSTEFAPNPYGAYDFETAYGYQGMGSKLMLIPFYAWAVSPGQVAAVPVPGAVWLMGSGILGLLSLKRRGHAGSLG
jgi:hypothetical protein